MIPKDHIKLFVDAHVFDNEHQGSRTFIKELYAHLCHKNDIEFYFGAYDIENLQQYFPLQANIHFVKYKSRRRGSRLLFNIPFIIKKYGIDYAHFQYIVPLIKNCRFIVTTHDVLFNEFPEDFSFWYRLHKKFLYKLGVKKANILTTVSHHSRNAIEKYLKVNTTQIHVLSNGINPKYFANYNKADAIAHIHNRYGIKKFILFVSRIEPRKNHITLLQAYADLNLNKLGYDLVFIGHQSTATPAFNHLLNSLPQETRLCVHLINSVSDDELLNFYRAATVFVFPSKAEGFGFPPLEAGALKIPVLCSDNAALSDFTFFGDHLVSVNNYINFKNKLFAMINYNNEQALVNIAASIKQQYDWATTAEKFYSLLKDNSTI